MPKYGIHHIVMEKAAANLASSPHPAVKKTADILKNHPDLATLGAIGPDLFFWGPDYDICQLFTKFYKNYEMLKGALEEVVKPIEVEVERIKAEFQPVIDKVMDAASVKITREVIKRAQDTAKLLKSAIGTSLLSGVIKGINLFDNPGDLAPKTYEIFQNLFAPKIGSPEADWYWFDMLHYRNTGKFAENLITLANFSNDQECKAYAYGYLSHVATDVTGHSFVNQISGTVYRRHVQRHVTIENFMDAWAFQEVYQQNINQSLAQTLALPDSLNDKVAHLLDCCFQKTYGNILSRPIRLKGGKNSNGFYTHEDIQDTFTLFKNVLDLLSGLYVEEPQEPLAGISQILSGLISSFPLPPKPSIQLPRGCSWGDILAFGKTPKSRDCYEAFFQDLSKLLDELGALLAYSFDLLFYLIDLALALLEVLPALVVLAFLYGIQLLCYQIYQRVREILALNGLLMPEPYQVDKSNSIGQNLIQPNLSSALMDALPSINTPACSNLTWPVPHPERPPTTAGFHYNFDLPSGVMENFPFSEQAILDYSQAASPSDSRKIEMALPHKCIGNSVAFTAWLIEKSINPGSTPRKAIFPNWNLDADRGYGYLAWYGVPPRDETGGDINHPEDDIVLLEEYQDPRLAKYIGHDVTVVGHRGSPNKKIENTIESFEVALADGANGLETDVAITEDNQVILWHDWDPSDPWAKARQGGLESDNKYKPLVPAVGSPYHQRVCELSAADLEKYYGYENKDDGTERPVKVFLLENLFDQASRWSRLSYLFLDVKVPKKDMSVCLPPIMNEISRLLTAYNPTFKTVINTTDPDVLKEMQKNYPDLTYQLDAGVPISPVTDPVDYKKKLSAVERAITNNCSFASVGHGPIQEDFPWDVLKEVLHYDVHRLLQYNSDPNRKGREIQGLYCWSINDEKEMETLLRAGIRIMATDLPDLAVYVAKQELGLNVP